LFSIDRNLAHYAAINRGAELVRIASLPTKRSSSGFFCGYCSGSVMAQNGR
jgi:hypothetical protein